MSSEKALLCLAIRDERDGERTGCWPSPAGRLCAARRKSRAGSQKTEGGIITSRTLVMQVLDPFALRLPGGSSPQSALGEPRMGAQILLIFGARLLLHQPHIVLEGHRLSIQALDWNRLDASCWLPDVEALLGGIHIAGDSLASQASAHIVLFSVERQLPIGPDRARKGLPIDLQEPAIRIDRLWNAQERREGRTGYTRRLVATGACLVGPLAVVVGEIRFSELRDL